MKRAVNDVHRLTVGATICALLEELSVRPSNDKAQTLRADIVSAIDARQLSDFIQETVNGGVIHPKPSLLALARPAAANSIIDNNAFHFVGWQQSWYLTGKDQVHLRAALAERIDARVEIYNQRSIDREASAQNLAQEKLAAARYTLQESAAMMHAQTGDDEGHLLKSLISDASNDELPVYMPGSNLKVRMGQGRPPAVQYLEAYWNDLNSWIETHEPRLPFRFESPEREPDTSDLVDSHIRNSNAIELTPEVLNDDYGEDGFIRGLDRVSAGSVPPPPPGKLIWQEDQILRTIETLGYRALALPPNRLGAKGVKSEVLARCISDNKNSWLGAQFKHAWDRLGAARKIQYAK